VTRGRGAGLTDRRSERDALDRLADAVRGGQSRALVVRGEPGVGKTVLLDYLAGRARQCRVARAVGVQTEMELAFAGLHQLCAPMLGRAEHLPVPQRDALRTAFGLAAGPPPDRFLVGLAALSLRFRHSLLRLASYRTASVADRQAVHGALAEATDPEIAPERRAWHRAQAAAEPDEEVAAELERSAGRAQARGGWPLRRRSWSARRC